MQINGSGRDEAVKSSGNSNETGAEQFVPRGRGSRALTGLIVVLSLEFAAILGAALYLIAELLVDRPDSYASAVALAIVVAIAAVWVVFIVVGVVRGQAWTRAAVVVLQILIGAVAVGSLQGAEPRVDLGIGLLMPAVLTLVLLFSKSVLAHLSERENRTL